MTLVFMSKVESEILFCFSLRKSSFIFIFASSIIPLFKVTLPSILPLPFNFPLASKITSLVFKKEFLTKFIIPLF